MFPGSLCSAGSTESHTPLAHCCSWSVPGEQDHLYVPHIQSHWHYHSVPWLQSCSGLWPVPIQHQNQVLPHQFGWYTSSWLLSAYTYQETQQVSVEESGKTLLCRLRLQTQSAYTLILRLSAHMQRCLTEGLVKVIEHLGKESDLISCSYALGSLWQILNFTHHRYFAFLTISN